MKFLSIAIPTYEMDGKGSEYLEFSFNKIKSQTFKDFEVVVSDHSKDNSIKDLCEKWSPVLDIKYLRNLIDVGSSSSNINNAIKNSEGQWIKILFQDDFLFDNESLMNTYNSIVSNNESKWFVSKCQHSNDGETFYRENIPSWNDRMLFGNNTISSPSVLTIKNDDSKLFFDNNYIWLMDCDYYQSCYNIFGLPIIINYVTVVNRTWSNQLTNKISEYVKSNEYLSILIKHKIIKDLRKVTLVTMTSVDIENTVKAMIHSCRGIVFGDIKFISDVKPESLPPQFKYCQIDKMNSVDDYSFNIVYNLHKFIDTEFALIIQADGYIVNPHMWQDYFLNYDYIGAPWGLPNDDFSFRDPFNNLIRVGNGGFSLRSKKILSLPTELKLEWKSYFGYYNEDGFFTCHNRHIFEKEGCVFAPLDVAKYFSHEAEIPETHGIEPFGFHGKWSKYINRQ